MKRLFSRPYTVLAICAVLLAFSFPTFHWYPLTWVVLAPLIAQSWHASPREAAKRFFFVGWLFHTLLLQWLAANIFWAGGWAVLGQQGLCVLLALFWAGTGALWRWAHVRIGLERFQPLTLAILWYAMEYLQSFLFTGFGWSALGYSQGGDLWFAQLAAVGGVSFLSFLMVICNGQLAQAIGTRERRWRRLPGMAALVAGSHAAGAALLGPAPETAFHVGLYQSNYSQEMKFDRDFAELMVDKAVEQSRRLAEVEPVDLFVWPEALVMADIRDPLVLEKLQGLTASAKVPLFAGSVRLGSAGEDFNSSVYVDTAGEIAAHYDKVHLAPFGEYIPLNIPLLNQVVRGQVSFGEKQLVIDTNTGSLGPLICFEVLFSSMAMELRRLGADYLVVITNLAWFGASNAIGQELEIARLRAIESRLPLIHSSNTGISGTIDPYGRLRPVNAILTADHYYKWPEGRIGLAQTRMQRMVGSLPVTQAAPQPFAAVVTWAPRAALLLGILLMLWAALAPRARKQPE